MSTSRAGSVPLRVARHPRNAMRRERCDRGETWMRPRLRRRSPARCLAPATLLVLRRTRPRALSDDARPRKTCASPARDSVNVAARSRSSERASLRSRRRATRPESQAQRGINRAACARQSAVRASRGRHRADEVSRDRGPRCPPRDESTPGSEGATLRDPNEGGAAFCDPNEGGATSTLTEGGARAISAMRSTEVESLKREKGRSARAS